MHPSLWKVEIALRAGTLAAVASLACAGEGPRAEGPIAVDAERLIGTYRYLADAGLFTECTTGARIPVAMEADNATLERAYLEARDAPGQELVVTVLGSVEKRPPLEGTGTRDFLIVTRFEQVWPSESCETSTRATPLEDTHWRLVELGGTGVEVRQDEADGPHIRLESAERRMSGFGGCNRFTGSYEADADALEFGPLATTMMACPDLDEEVAFTRALGDARRFLILGGSLVLSGDAGDLARFEAVAGPAGRR